MGILCVVLYLLIGYATAVGVYIAEKDDTSAAYGVSTRAFLSVTCWPVVLVVLSVAYIARAVTASVVFIGEKLNSKLKG